MALKLIKEEVGGAFSLFIMGKLVRVPISQSPSSIIFLKLKCEVKCFSKTFLNFYLLGSIQCNKPIVNNRINLITLR